MAPAEGTDTGIFSWGPRVFSEPLCANTLKYLTGDILEAQASSEIENIVTTTDQLFRFTEAGEDRADPATNKALRYSTAL